MERNIVLSIVLLIIFTLSIPLIGNSDRSGERIIIGEKYTIKSMVLKENREIYIYKPKGYNKSDNKYPVYYLLEANVNFSFTVGIIEYLSSYGMIPKMIIVGVSNVDRNRDMTPSQNKEFKNRYRTAGGADNFLSFLEKELFPFIKKNFRIYPYRIISGHSLGGLFVCHTLITKPNLFDAYISISPSLWWNKNEMISKIRHYINKHGFDDYLCLTIADEGGAKTTSEYKNLVHSIQKDSKKKDRVIFKRFPDENHVSNAVASTFFALKNIYKNWRLTFETMSGGLKQIIDHYKYLSKEFKYNIPLLESTLNSAGYNLLFSGKTDAAIEIFEYIVKTNPKSSNALDSLAEAYMKKGNTKMAVKNYLKILELSPENKNATKMLKKLSKNNNDKK